MTLKERMIALAKDLVFLSIKRGFDVYHLPIAHLLPDSQGIETWQVTIQKISASTTVAEKEINK